MHSLRQIVTYYRRKFETSNPFEIADCLGILYQFGNLNFEGCYMFLKKHKYIYLMKNKEILPMIYPESMVNFFQT